jgi:hypothetical protein
MVPLTSLLLPILAAAVVVFVASFVFHMLLPFHQQDWRSVPDEARARAAIGPLALPPGDYMIPRGAGPASMKDPAFIEKLKQGPVLIMTVFPNGAPTMGRALSCWFLFCVAVLVFAAYVAGRALGPGAPYLDVFRFVGTVAFVGFSMALWPQSIWYRRAYRTTVLETVEGLVYGLLAAGVFGWLWPR